MPAFPKQVRIDRIGARGDGIAETPDGPVYVPYSLAGDLADISPGAARGNGRTALLDRIVEPGPGRQVPPCRHFGACGGCALQHVGDAQYRAWKRGLVTAALGRRGIETDIASVVSVAPGTRRRVRLAFQRTAAGVVLGFREAASRRIVDLTECPVASPAIVALLPALRNFLRSHSRGGEVAVTETMAGLDVTVFAAEDIGLELRMDAAPFCEAAGLVRLSWSAAHGPPEQIVALLPVTVTFGGTEVNLPADAFLQPTVEGERLLTGFVLSATEGAVRVADLYAGCGAFALPLAAAGKAVHAVEGLPAQTAALHRAAPEMDVETRDLARRPLAGAELDRLDAVVLDPPRAGAAAQVEELAAGSVPSIVYVSCNPATFARDARILIDGGYNLDRVLPVDQFLWSTHVELASVFTRR